jgi:hypothetical protein
MSTLQFSRLTAALVLAAITLSGSARAETSDAVAAQALFDQARALMASGKADQACPKFAESQRLDPGVGTLLNLAACYETSGRPASAWSTFLEAESAARAANNAEGVRVSRERAAALAPKLTKLRVTVAEPALEGLEVRRDGRLVGREQWGLEIPVDPGKHTLSASAPAHLPWQTELEAREPGRSVSVEVPALERSSAEQTASSASHTTPVAPNDTSHLSVITPNQQHRGIGTQRWLAIGAGVIGVAGVTIGTVFGLKSMSKHDEAEKHCDGADCRDTTGVGLRSDAREAGNLSTLGFVLGGIGLAGGAVLWFTASSHPTEPSTALELTPTRLTHRTRF